MPRAPGARRGAFFLAAALIAAQDKPLDLQNPREARPSAKPARRRSAPLKVPAAATAKGVAAEADPARDGASLFAKSAIALRPILEGAPAESGPRPKSEPFSPVPTADLLFETGRFAPALTLHPFTILRGTKPAEPAPDPEDEPAAPELEPLRPGALRAGLIQEVPGEPSLPRIAPGSVHWALEPPEALHAGALPAVRATITIPGSGLSGELRIGRGPGGPGASRSLSRSRAWAPMRCRCRTRRACAAPARARASRSSAASPPAPAAAQSSSSRAIRSTARTTSAASSARPGSTSS
jgi:hypothetical protein